MEKCSASGFEYGGGGHRPRDVGSFRKLEKAKEWNFLLKPLAGMQPCRYLEMHFLTFGLQNCKLINLGCLMPVILWQSVTVLIRKEFRSFRPTAPCFSLQNYRMGL